jgi:hypothetical protein
MFRETGALNQADLDRFVNFQAAENVRNDDAGDDTCTTRTKPYQIYSPLGCLSDSEANPFTSQSGRAAASSHQHAMRSRFVETTPKYMRCSERLSEGSWMDRKSAALDCRYIQPNSTSRIAWQVFDLDFAGAADAFDEKNVAVPNFITVNPENGHAHYGYALEVPVSNSARSRREPMAYLQAIRAGMTRRLGADPNFKFGLGKNPLHPHWRTAWLNSRAHSLNDMAVWLEADEMRPVHNSRVAENEFAEQGRNCSITSDLAKWGLRTAWRFKEGGSNSEQFLREARAQAFELNNCFAEPLGFREVQTIAKSVAKWAWARSSAERFSEIQSFRAQARRRHNLALLAGVPDLASMNNQQIADLLGRSTRTARRYVATPRAEYEANSISAAKPWEALGISRRTYYNRKAAGTL